MIALGHTAVGVIVGVGAFQFLGQGDLAAGLIITGTAGVISHYIGDFIPHGHFVKADKVKKYLVPIIIFDVFLPIVLFLGEFYLKNGLSEEFLFILFGIGGAQLPDVIDGLIYTNQIKVKGLVKAENDFHQSLLHWHGRGSKALLLGLRDIWQVLLIVIAIFLI